MLERGYAMAPGGDDQFCALPSTKVLGDFCWGSPRPLILFFRDLAEKRRTLLTDFAASCRAAET